MGSSVRIQRKQSPKCIREYSTSKQRPCGMSNAEQLEALCSEHRRWLRALDDLTVSDPEMEEKRDVIYRNCHDVVDRAVGNLSQGPLDEQLVKWFEAALVGDDATSAFATAVLKKIRVPKNLALFALELSIQEPNPSANRWFVVPALRGLGMYEACQRLLYVMENGSNYEKAGALNAIYWAAARTNLVEEGISFKEGVEKSSPECARLLREIQERVFRICLLEFEWNEDLDLRRSFVRWISADESKYSEELRPVARQAVEIALGHPDDFIRECVERQLTHSPLISALPPRRKP
jgi:hypothetical protein